MADEAGLPEFFDPLLDYLSSVLPTQLYSLAASGLYYIYALLASAFHAAATIVKTPLATWDAERILPPVITLLAAYLALLSFYRTTGWMIRTAFAFAKWGFILSALSAAAGYFLANANLEGQEGAGVGHYGLGLVSSLGAMLWTALNGDGRKSPSTGQRAHTRTQKQSRPKPWESWDQHRNWQYNEAAARDGHDASQDGNIQEVVGKIIGSASKVMQESGWWETAKNVAGEFTKSTRGGDQDNTAKRTEHDTVRKDKTQSR